MGSSEWYNFVPYQVDANRALQELREREFRDGKYYNFVDYQLEQLREMSFEDYNPYEHDPRYWWTEADFERWRTTPQPETMEDLIKLQEDSGTSSPIDIDGISPEPAFRMATPLSPQQLIDLFGTEKPAREMIERERSRLAPLIDGWMAVYTRVYEDGQPAEIFFYGITGD